MLQVNGAKGNEAWREGREGCGKKMATEKRADGERRQESPVCQLLVDGELGCETIGESFVYFSQKNKDEGDWELLEMLQCTCSYMYCLLHCLKMIWQCIRSPIRLTNVLALYAPKI